MPNLAKHCPRVSMLCPPVLIKSPSPSPPYLHQGRIEPPKVARGHATFVDGKMLSVTSIEFKFYWYKHVNRRRVPLMWSLTAKWFFEMAGIPSAAT